MPIISSFFGIVIRMYYDDHAPPHFHAAYGDYSAVFEIQEIAMTEGELPRRAQSLVVEWAGLDRDELLENWRRCEAHVALIRIAPLE